MLPLMSSDTHILDEEKKMIKKFYIDCKYDDRESVIESLLNFKLTYSTYEEWKENSNNTEVEPIICMIDEDEDKLAIGHFHPSHSDMTFYDEDGYENYVDIDRRDPNDRTSYHRVYVDGLEVPFGFDTYRMALANACTYYPNDFEREVLEDFFRY